VIDGHFDYGNAGVAQEITNRFEVAEDFNSQHNDCKTLSRVRVILKVVANVPARPQRCRLISGCGRHPAASPGQISTTMRFSPISTTLAQATVSAFDCLMPNRSNNPTVP
jgi:hypothetical protein